MTPTNDAKNVCPKCLRLSCKGIPCDECPGFNNDTECDKRCAVEDESDCKAAAASSDIRRQLSATVGKLQDMTINRDELREALGRAAKLNAEVTEQRDAALSRAEIADQKTKQQGEFIAILGKSHSEHLAAIVQMFRVTAAKGPGEALEFIGDYLNGCDAIEDGDPEAWQEARDKVQAILDKLAKADAIIAKLPKYHEALTACLTCWLGDMPQETVNALVANRDLDRRTQAVLAAPSELADRETLNFDDTLAYILDAIDAIAASASSVPASEDKP